MTQDTPISQPDPTGPVSEGVTQADRDAAARWCGYGPETNDRIRAGELDHLPGVQAFARHRLASPINSALVEAIMTLIDRAADRGFDVGLEAGKNGGLGAYVVTDLHDEARATLSTANTSGALVEAQALVNRIARQKLNPPTSGMTRRDMIIRARELATPPEQDRSTSKGEGA